MTKIKSSSITMYAILLVLHVADVRTLEPQQDIAIGGATYDKMCVRSFPHPLGAKAILFAFEFLLQIYFDCISFFRAWYVDD